jgi:hypothetical protein
MTAIGTGIVLFCVAVTFVVAGDAAAELYQRVTR